MYSMYTCVVGLGWCSGHVWLCVVWTGWILSVWCGLSTTFLFLYKEFTVCLKLACHTHSLTLPLVQWVKEASASKNVYEKIINEPEKKQILRNMRLNSRSFFSLLELALFSLCWSVAWTWEMSKCRSHENVTMTSLCCDWLITLSMW